MNWSACAREFSIEDIRSEGSEQDQEKLERWLALERERGTPIPIILLQRLANKWVRHDSKVRAAAYMSPTILKQWKDSLPAPVACWFFHESDIVAIEDAYYFDLSKEIGKGILQKNTIGVCVAYRILSGEGESHKKWLQGDQIFHEMTPQQRSCCKMIAGMIYCAVNSGNYVEDLLVQEDFDKKWLYDMHDKTTEYLHPGSFTGIGKKYFDNI